MERYFKIGATIPAYNLKFLQKCGKHKPSSYSGHPMGLFPSSEHCSSSGKSPWNDDSQLFQPARLEEFNALGVNPKIWYQMTAGSIY